MAEIDFSAIEKKWQDKWEQEKAFVVSEDSKKKKYYVLEMFPYPSGDGLHMGHALNYTIGDVCARFKRMSGFNVLYPMGYDALGLPAENAAIKAGTHPEEYTKNSIQNFMRQQKMIGLSYDWNRMVNTSDPAYYKWDQWIFLKMLEKDLAYQKESEVNYCPQCETVLANEQVHNGKCWRHEDTDVIVKNLKQWFFKITAYADELYESINSMDSWPERTKIMQQNWIGKSHGTEINFDINGTTWPVFTTRPDTIFGVTFMVVSLQHEKLMDIVTKDQQKEVAAFLKKINAESATSEKEQFDKEKEGVFTGAYAINPATNEKIPVYAGNFVVADYGSGMVMGVPAHDQRDFEFAKKYGIDIKQVVAPFIEETEGKDAVREDKETVARDSVFGIVKHWEKDEYYCLDWKDFGWKSFVIGGVDDGETHEDAVVREVKEETGYQDIQSVTPVSIETHSAFFASHKDINRHSRDRAFFIELGSGEWVEPEEEHVKHHKGEWIAKEHVAAYVNLENNSHFWNDHAQGEKAYTGDGVLINSQEFDGMKNTEAITKISDWLIKKKKAQKVVNYRIRDWGISRQRYWGTPIPIIHCDSCGAVPVPEKDLPVELPKDVTFGKGNPLETASSWLQVPCPSCGKEGQRETDTMDTFVNSSWYFLRYADAQNDKKIFDTKKANYWCPVDQYIGGSEHACMHLIYFRYYTKFLADLGIINFREPAVKLFHQGMLHGEGGIRMSKSKGNVVNPETVSEKYGIDTARYFLLSLAEPDKNRDWSEAGIQGSLRFIKKACNAYSNIKVGKSTPEITSRIHSAIQSVTEDITSFRYRMATITLKELFEAICKETEMSKEDLSIALQLLSPICPHVAEELWEGLGNKGFISLSAWPKTDSSKILQEKKKQLDLNSKVTDEATTLLQKVDGKKVYVYVVPFELTKVDAKKIEKAVGKPVSVYALNDAQKHDPAGKAKKARPGMPSVYVE